MDSIKIQSGEKRIAINDDPNRVIVFNPSDVTFAEKFYKLIGEFENKSKEYKERFAELETAAEKDEHGFPVNMQERMELLKEVCNYIRRQIDNLFGIGTSDKAFGDSMQLDMFIQFFDGMTPFVQEARKEKLAQYTTTASAKRNKRK